MSLFKILKLLQKISSGKKTYLCETTGNSYQVYNIHKYHELAVIIFKKSDLIFQGGIYVLNLFNWYTASYSLMILGLVQLVMISWIYGKNIHLFKHFQPLSIGYVHFQLKLFLSKTCC